MPIPRPIPKPLPMPMPMPRPICEVLCIREDPSPYCAGPISGCGQLIDFTTKCALASYNCHNPDNRKYRPNWQNNNEKQMN